MHDLFARPGFLWLLCLLALLPLLARRSRARMTLRQRAWTLAARALLLALLAVALAGPRVPWVSRRVAVVFAVDRSASVTPEAEAAGRDYARKALAARHRGDEAIFLGFAGTVRSLPPPGRSAPESRAGTENKEKDAWPEQPERDATAIAKALSFSAATFPDGTIRRLVLLSDGYDTEGRSAEAARALREAGVEFFTVPLRNPSRPEVLVEKFALPGELREGEPFDATATLRSNVETACTVRLYTDGFLAGEQSVTLKPGGREVRFRSLKPGKNQSAWEVQIAPEKDTLPGNNRAVATAAQSGRPRLLLVDPAPERLQPLKNVLSANRIEVETRPVEGLPGRIEELQGYDALILSDVSALHLSRAQMQLYARWVKDFGGGFAMLGGENSFGVGGYFRTPIEAILPVKTDHDDTAETPSVALMIVLDSSGSMNAQVAGQTKMALANQGAAMALDVLAPKDLFGVMAVDTRVHLVAPLARHPDKADVSRDILRVRAGGGGIYVYTSLVEAFARLREAKAKIKHIILFSDAADAEEKAAGEMPDGTQVPGTAVDLAAAMASAKITTSVVALGGGADKDLSFLKQLALVGGGRFYLTSDALTLPQIFTTETMRVAQSSLSEDPVSAIPARRAEVLEGIDWKSAPLLLGHNITKLKPTAELLLATESGDPLLAIWQYGLGRVAAFTSDAKSRWASEWLGWPGYGKFWTQLARRLARPSGQGHGLSVQSYPEPGGVRVEIDAVTAAGAFRNGLPLSVGALLPDGTATATPARQIAPGRYRAFVATSGTGATWIRVHPGGGNGVGPAFGYTPSYPAEFLHNGTDESALARLAASGGGKFNPPAESLFARPETGVRRHRDLAPFFLAAALLLLPVDIWLRRRVWGTR